LRTPAAEVFDGITYRIIYGAGEFVQFHSKSDNANNFIYNRNAFPDCPTFSLCHFADTTVATSYAFTNSFLVTGSIRYAATRP